jgi:hypothetical protein
MGRNEPADSSLTDLEDAAARGDDLDMQLAMRRIVAAKIADPTCPARELASLTKRLHEINREIKELQAARAEEHGDPSSAPPEAWDPEAI